MRARCSRRRVRSRRATTSAARRPRRSPKPSPGRASAWLGKAGAVKPAETGWQSRFTQIGKYPVLRKLAEGATSEVYHCTDPFNGREVAIKVAFPETFQDPDRGKLYRKLFLTEASLAGKLQHPHICQIFDAVAEESLNYI